MAEMQVLNRITVADILRGAKVPKLDDKGVAVLKDGKPVMEGLDKDVAQDLYLLMGRAKEYKTGTTQYGDYREYFGPMEAKRICDGKVYQAGRVIFPPPTDAVVENQFDAAKSEDKNAEVGFAFIIGVEEHTHAGEKKFRYTCKPISLGDTVQNDPLADIRAAVSAEMPGLLPSPPAAKAIAAPETNKAKP